jgi:hypothetical protein
MLLSPTEAADVLEQRVNALRGQLAGLEAELAEVAFLPRVVLMDDEYQRAMFTAELTWLESMIADLRSGTLTWEYQDFAELAGHIQPSGEQNPDALSTPRD